MNDPVYGIGFVRAKNGAKRIHVFSDNCGGQNRNRFIAVMLWHVRAEFGLEEVKHTFLEKGHTENENDSIHSVIERATRRSTIYTPDQWYHAVRTARKSKTPYYVKEM